MIELMVGEGEGAVEMVIIPSERAMLEHLEAEDREQAKKHLYKSTACGAWIEFE